MYPHSSPLAWIVFHIWFGAFFIQRVFVVCSETAVHIWGLSFLPPFFPPSFSFSTNSPSFLAFTFLPSLPSFIFCFVPSLPTPFLSFSHQSSYWQPPLCVRLREAWVSPLSQVFPMRSSGWDSELPLQGARVPSLVRKVLHAAWFVLCCAVLCLVPQSCRTLCDPMDCSPLGSSVHGDSPGKNTRVSCNALLQGIFPTQGSNPGLQHCRQILYHLRHQGSPRILKWVVYPFFRGSSQPRNWTGVSCIAGGFFTIQATREAHGIAKGEKKGVLAHSPMGDLGKKSHHHTVGWRMKWLNLARVSWGHALLTH